MLPDFRPQILLCVYGQRDRAWVRDLRGNILRLRAGYVFFANRCKQTEFDDATEHMRGDVGTTRVVAEIFLQFFFATIWTYETCLNSYPRHSRNPGLGNPPLCSRQKVW